MDDETVEHMEIIFQRFSCFNSHLCTRNVTHMEVLYVLQFKSPDGAVHISNLTRKYRSAKNTTVAKINPLAIC